MNAQYIIEQLAINKEIYKNLLRYTTHEEIGWKENPGKWSLLEIICHLYDEEREDFRQRTQLLLEDPTQALPKFDPLEWVTSRNYATQDYQDKLIHFLLERQRSVNWLRSLENPAWTNAIEHPMYGAMSAYTYLANWLAHDHLHIRQITRVKYNYLKEISSQDLDYAGKW